MNTDPQRWVRVPGFAFPGSGLSFAAFSGANLHKQTDMDPDAGTGSWKINIIGSIHLRNPRFFFIFYLFIFLYLPLGNVSFCSRFS